MKNYKYLLYLVLCLHGTTSFGQDINCSTGTIDNDTSYQGAIFSNYGSLPLSSSSSYKNLGSVGELFIGPSIQANYQLTAGFYGRFHLPPTAPVVKASEGNLVDRIEITWEVDALSPSAESGYNIYRDGSLIANVDKEVRNYIDFNVLPGQFYTYEVAGVSQFGEGNPGSSLGFMNPNGVITGQIRTLSNNPVADAEITLTPNLGHALVFDGDDMAFIEPTEHLLTPNWSVSFWFRAEDHVHEGYILDYGINYSVNFGAYVRGGNGDPKKLYFEVGDDDRIYTSSYELSDQSSTWYHVAAVYTGSSLLFYVDGNLISSIPALVLPESDRQLILGNTSGIFDGYFSGSIDELRIFNRQLSQTEINQYKNRTINSDAEGLAAYWKFDEGIGTKAYDLSDNKITMFLCGPEWSDDRPDIVNGGVSDESGFYKIEDINYGAGETFTVTPSKISFNNYALEFNGSNSAFASLPDSILFGAGSTSISIRLNNFENVSEPRTLLSKRNAANTEDIFRIFIEDNTLKIYLGGGTGTAGALSEGYNHIVVLFSEGYLGAFMNGVHILDNAWFFQNPNLEKGFWTVGATGPPGSYTSYFSGLIDDIAFFDTSLNLVQVQEIDAEGISAELPRLSSWFPFNESMGSTTEDMGLARTGLGQISNASWSNVTGISDEFAHEFQPDKRLVTLNANNSSVDQIDFTDLSTIEVTGYVRYDGTFCYADSVEILVNGNSFSPPVFTNNEGKFSIDFEPGSSTILSPKFKNHKFSPANWELSSLNAPVAGILFRDITKRKINGRISGGLCRKSIIPQGTTAEIYIQSLDECFERTIDLNHDDHASGWFTAANLPPIPLTIAVSDHDNPAIENFFSLAGGEKVNLTDEDIQTEFIYFSMPNVQIDTFAKNQCGDVILEQYQSAFTNVRVFEDYYGEKCYLDTFNLSIIDNISDREQFDTLVKESNFRYRLSAGVPRLDAPHTKLLDISADVDGRLASSAVEAVVTGERPRATTFASTTPTFPLLILRDPPGDGSFAYVEKGQSICKDLSFFTEDTKGGGDKFHVSLGPEFSIGAGLGVWKEEKLTVVAQTTEDFHISRSQTSSNTEKVCLTTTEKISTSSSDDIVGSQGGDVFVGTALNVIFGSTDVLKYDESSCSLLLDTSFMIHPEGFASTTIYSEYFVRNTLLPNLKLLKDTLSYSAWSAILDKNQQYKKDAVADQTISFDAGVKYEYSFKKDSSTSDVTTFDSTFTNDLLVAGGAFWSGVGASHTIRFNVQLSKSTTESNSETSTFNVGYELSDDDPGDFFAVHVKNDKKFGVPVFDTESGTSSCPWEPNTQNRDEVSLTVDRNIAINVPENDAAVFKLSLGNISQSAEKRGYVLQVANGSNPDGAVIKVNGQPLTSGISYSVDFSESQEVTLTIERGPVEYDYEGLEVGWYSDCEYSRAGNIGLPVDEKFYKSVKLNVHFLEPCSPVNINSPNNGTVITPNDDDIVPIRLVEYNENDDELEYISTQYRRANANGVWINIAETDKEDLDPVFETVDWNTAGFSDGFYEIRAITTCKSGLNPGISKVVTIQIERSAPELLGVPEPSDGVLSRGDEISISFNESINCLKIFQADIFANNNIGLYNSRTGELIDAEISCLENKIVVVPNTPNQFIEGEILRVQVDSIQDGAGNLFVGTSWEFYVDRSVIQMEGGDIDVVMYEGEEMTIYRKLVNVGGSIANYELKESPVWANILPKSGSLDPGNEVDIRFKFESNLPQGTYRDTLYLENSQGDERVILNLRVLCPPPNWTVDIGQYPQNMNFILKLNIEGKYSADAEDLVVALIDGEIRGVENIVFEDAFDEYVAYLTVYGDDDDLDKPVDLQIWDASECLHYNRVIEKFQFIPNEVIGNVDDPVSIHTNSFVQRSIPLRKGWNWISFNLQFNEKSPDSVLHSLNHPENDLIKSQTQFSEYFGTNWVGSLQEIGNSGMYQYRTDVEDTILMTGTIINPDTFEIDIVEGWNWIGYIPNNTLPVDLALANLSPLNGDIIKSQEGFAQYVAGNGWVGSLNFMQPPKGYQLKISNAGTLTYPSVSGTTRNWNRQSENEDSQSDFWAVNPSDFEFSSTLVGYFSANGQNITGDNHEIGAFVDGELRGSASAIYVDAIDAHLFFLTMYSNESDESVEFRLYDKALDNVFNLQELVQFIPDEHIGSVQSPMPFTEKTTSITDESLSQSFEVFPNPFGQSIFIEFRINQNSKVKITILDALGSLVKQNEFAVESGIQKHKVDMRGFSDGIYYLQVETSERIGVRKIVKDR